MTVLGVGIDLVKTNRFFDILHRSPSVLSRISRKVLHPVELKAFVQQENPRLKIQQLASAWAVKEATYKSLSIGDQRKFKFTNWRKITRLHGFEMVQDGPKPGSELKENTELPREDQVLVSLSHDGEYTVAYAIRQTLFVPIK